MAYTRKRRRKGRRRGSRKDLDLAKSPDCSKADTLKAAAVSYFLKGGYSCFLELGLSSWGARRADMLGLNLRQKIVVAEVKSSPRDYKTDTKWREYLNFCDRFYFIMCPATLEKLKPRLKIDLKGTGAGVMVLNPDTGYLEVVKKAAVRELDDETRLSLITRMAWRGGISKRTNRRTRHYLKVSDDGQDQEKEAQAHTASRRRVRSDR